MWASSATRQVAVARNAVGHHSARRVVTRPRPSIRGPVHRHHKALQVRANAQEKALVIAKEALKVGTTVVETASGWVPESVPRPAAKAIVAVGSIVVFGWIFQKVLSTVITLALLVGGAWLWINASSKDDGASGGGGGGGGGAGNDDDEDPVAQARRIMDKYK